MRYDQTIIFIHETDGYYDFDLGEHVSGIVTQTPMKANVTDLGAEMSVKLFGSIKEGALVVRLLRHYTQPYDYLMIDGVSYELLKEQKLRHKHTLIVREVVRSG